MSCPLDSEQPPDVIFRIGRRSPWDWPDWANVGDDGTFGNRWDDPQGLYRVLYASSVRLGCYLETLARLRPDPAVIAALQVIEGPEPMDPVGLVPPLGSHSDASAQRPSRVSSPLSAMPARWLGFEPGSQQRSSRPGSWIWMRRQFG